MMNELKKKPNNFCGFGCLFQKSVAFVSHDRWASLRGIISSLATSGVASPCNRRTRSSSGNFDNQSTHLGLSWDFPGFLFKHLVEVNKNGGKDLSGSKLGPRWKCLWKDDCESAPGQVHMLRDKTLNFCEASFHGILQAHQLCSLHRPSLNRKLVVLQSLPSCSDLVVLWHDTKCYEMYSM